MCTETSFPGDTEDTVNLPVEVADIAPPRAPQVRVAFETMNCVNVVEILQCRDEIRPAFRSRSFRTQ